MPLFSPQSLAPILDRLTAPQLPDIGQLRGISATPQALDAAEIHWRRESAAAWQRAAQQGLAALGVRVGWPAMQLAAVGPSRPVWEAAQAAFGQLDFAVASATVARELILESDLLASAVGAGTQAASAVPIAGAIARLIFTIAQAVRATRAVDAGQTEARRLDPGALQPVVDAALWQDDALPMLMGSLDWTDLWSPPSWPTGLETANHLAYFQDGEIPGGWAVRPSSLGPARGESGVGAVPGTTLLHAGSNAIKVEARATYWRISDTGTFLPTAAQQATWLWEAVQAGGPACFCVDTSRLEDRWTRYLWSLRSYLRQRVRTDVAREIVDAALYRDAFGWGRWHTSGRPEPTDYPGAYGLSRSSLLARIRALRDLQLRALRWTAVYVAPDSAALRDPELRSVWNLARGATLDAIPADVDLANVPDLEFRAELQRRIARGPTPFGGPTALAPETGFGISAVEDSRWPARPAADPVRVVASLADGGRPVRWGPAVVLGGAGLGAWWLLR